MLVQGVSRDVNAIGYFGYSYYVENKDKLQVGPDRREGGLAGRRARRWRRSSTAPTSRCRARSSSTSASRRWSKPEVRKFVEYYLTHGEKLAKEVKFVPLPAERLRAQQGAPGQEEARHGVRRRRRGRDQDRGPAEARSQALIGLVRRGASVAGAPSFSSGSSGLRSSCRAGVTIMDSHDNNDGPRAVRHTYRGQRATREEVHAQSRGARDRGDPVLRARSCR